jgi:hypothetical protein
MLQVDFNQVEKIQILKEKHKIKFKEYLQLIFKNQLIMIRK